MKKMNKRGNFQFTIIILVFMVIFAIAVPITGKIFEEMNTSVQEIDGIPTEFKDSFDNASGRYNTIWDGFFVFMLILLFVGTFISALFTDTNPVFFSIGIIALALMIFVLPFLANTYEGFATTTTFADTTTNYPITTFIMQHYVAIGVIMMSTIAIGLFSKRSAIQ